jgi:hypothetical protein
MFGYFSNSVSFGERPQIGIQITANNANRLRFRYNKADVPLTISGTVAATSNNSNDNYVWFASDASTTNPFKGQVGEVLLFNTALDPGQVSAVEQYLGTKWGV